MRLEGAGALVAGGASGLGRAAAEALRDRGARVIVVDLPSARERVEASSGLRFVAADVRDAGQVEAAVAAAATPLRVCVNCAGIAPPARILRGEVPQPLDAFQRVVDVNLVGTFNVLRLAAARMQGNEPLDGDRGVIVNTASAAAFDGQVGQAAYAASKAGVAGLTICAARDLADREIRVMTIAPGLFATPMLADLPAAVRDALERQVPHPSRLGRPDEYGALVVHVAENPMLNGETVRLDGALRMGPR